MADTLEHKANSNVTMALTLFAFSVGMVGMAYAAVPLYQLFCQVTGYGGTTQVSEAPAGRILDRQMTVRLDANVVGTLDWEFKPASAPTTTRIGETSIVEYVVTNNSNEVQTGSAVFNVTPQIAGYYFNKLECFCFTEQTVQPGETVRMPVTFFIDPDIADEADLKSVKTITLSYTFYPSDEEVPDVASVIESGANDS
ncbi:MAG: cytochrome c oxidase assembly protein [Cohaesibacteraceae bacterium]|nr:cytochrome c oxidase assembly protein [Cohaesibacteraceae bacterium]MBL4876166.1 cytochrome c oxidase assembly protein [Cohaesibacteraceae bacterium]